MTELYFVSIDYDDYRDFEAFLYEQLKYPHHGYSRFAESNGQTYVLELSTVDTTLISLKFRATITPFG